MNADLRKFLWMFAGFIAPLIVVFAILEWGLARAQNTYSKKRDALTQGRGAEILVVGSSHGLFGIDPELFSRPGISLANFSQSLIIDSQLCALAIPRMPRLATVVVTVSYFSLEFKLSESPEAWRSHFYVRYFGIPTDGPFYVRFDPSSYSLFLMYGPDQTRALLASGFSADLAPSVTGLGWQHLQGVRPNALEKDGGRQRVAEHEGMMHPSATFEIVQAVARLLSITNARHVRVAFVTTPVYGTYARAMSPGRWAGHQAQIRELARGHDAGYYDYLEDSRFGADDFYDNDHLNEDGAKKFTRILDAEVLKAAP